MQFKDIIGQRDVIERLVHCADSARVSHAQLMVGDEGVGALPLAIAYAQYLNCTNRHDGDSCGECPSCRQMAELVHPDLHFVFPGNTADRKKTDSQPLSNRYIAPWRDQIRRTGGYFSEQMWYDTIAIANQRGMIKVNEANELIRKLSFKSFESEYKIVILWLPERMNEDTANKLLKIFEEPWDKTLFLLVSEHPEWLLPTVVSRMQTVYVHGIAADDIASFLVAKKRVAPDRAAELGRLAQGSLLEAQRLMEEAAGDDPDFERFVQLMRLSYDDRHMELLRWADEVAALGREECRRLIDNSIRMLRDSYMLTAGVPNVSFLYGREYDFCKKFAPFVNNSNIEPLIGEFELAKKQVLQNGNPRIIFAHFVLCVSKLIHRLG